MELIEDPPVLEHKFQPFAADVVHEAARFSGYAARFGEPDSSGDVIHPNAFSRLLQSGEMPKLLWQHDQTRPIGVWEDISQDAVGLVATGRLLTDIQLAHEANVLIRAGVIDGLSIGYHVVRSERLASGGRHLLDVNVLEISLVTFPMASKARVQKQGTQKADPSALEALKKLTSLLKG
jgi:HK97 family phage prohead protease